MVFIVFLSLSLCVCVCEHPFVRVFALYHISSVCFAIP